MDTVAPTRRWVLAEGGACLATLCAATVGGVASVFPQDGWAAAELPPNPEPVAPEWIQSWRERVAQRKAKWMLRSALRGGSSDPRSEVGVFAAALAGIEVCEKIRALPVSKQVNPAVQELLGEQLYAIGRAYDLARQRVEAWADSQDEPAVTVSTLQDTLLEMVDRAEGSTPDRVVDVAVEELTRPTTFATFSRRMRGHCAEAREIRAHAESMSRSTAIPMEPATVEDDEGDEFGPVSDKARSARREALVALGILVAGGAILLGGVMVLLGILLIIELGGPGWVIVVLAGLGIILGGIRLGRTATRIGQDVPSDKTTAAPVSTTDAGPPETVWNPSPGVPTVVRTVRPTGEWVSSGVSLSDDRAYHVSAWGALTTPGGEFIGPDGVEPPAGLRAPLPPAPRGALLGRVQRAVFVLGTDADLPPYIVGPLELTINLDPETCASMEGAFAVHISVTE